ncbi:O-methyltransferase [Ferruginivarius sediminum]|uniref:SAM-dependent methyltransferase n=1 Tax=Ferruginivarius sediminum TaxID=2661937 RepID=A0A369TGC8_9PROT|nr:class I SAM-dependent methyltransferase [Ferruginivarius sediminum]RDD63882.1 SAM-dependent methyltransferase [Ferruginivarius sediminum]
MTRRTLNLDERLHRYLQEMSLREPQVLARLRQETARLDDPDMQIGPEQGQFMHLLVQLTGARRLIEIGTFTGYSSTWMALAMPEGGRIVTCDVSEDYTRIARRYWAEAGVTNKIDLRLAPALQTLDGLIAEGGRERYDFAFIDADKENYDGYYERCLTLIRPGGLVAVDNVLWGGSVVDPDRHEESVEAIRAFNAKLRDDERITLSMLPIGDGLTLARKR